MKIYLIVWHDAVSGGGGWEEPPEDVIEDTCFTTGPIVLEDDNTIVVAHTWDNQFDQTNMINGFIQIPKAWIESRTEIFDMSELDEVD